MATYIHENLQMDPVKLASWNPSDFKDVKDGLGFSIETAEHKGTIEIKYDEGSDTFEVDLYDTEHKNINGYREVYLFEIHEAVDNLVHDRVED